eukprot:scaffold39402_cov34-Phaeocystis_antarctica.AAC.2
MSAPAAACSFAAYSSGNSKQRSISRSMEPICISGCMTGGTLAPCCVAVALSSGRRMPPATSPATSA